MDNIRQRAPSHLQPKLCEGSRRGSVATISYLFVRPFKFLNHGISNIHGAALLLGAAGFLSRLLGILRDRLLTTEFGAGRELDIYYAAFQIPDFLSVVFLLGAASSAILPIFQEYRARDSARAHALVANLFVLFIVAGAGIALATFAAAPALMRYMLPGFSPEDRGLAISLTRIMLLAPILFGMSSILSSVAESFQRFWAYALAPLLYNCGIIFGIVFFVPWLGVWGLGAGVVLGAILHFLIQVRVVRDLGFGPATMLGLMRREYARGQIFFSEGVKRVITLSFPRVLSVSLSQLTLIALIALGSTLMKGSIAVFTLAQNLYFVPIGIFGVSYTVALFPRMSRAYIERDGDKFFHELFIGIRSILFWIVPSAMLFLVLRAHIVRVALGAGQFSWEDTRLTAAALAAMLVALACASLVSLLIKGFYALEHTWLPLVTNIWGSAVSLVAAWWFVRMIASRSPMGEWLLTLFRIQDIAQPEVLGLALGFALGIVLNIVPLYLTLVTLARRKMDSRTRFPFVPLAKIVIAALIAAGAAYLVRVSFSAHLPLITFVQVFVQGMAAGVAGIIVYFAALVILRSQDMYSFWESVRGHLFKIRALPKTWSGEEGQKI